MRRLLTRSGLFLCVLFFIGQGPAAAELIIKSGATLTLNNSDIYMNCGNLTIESGGTLDLGSGTIHDCGGIYISGTVVRVDGTILFCGGGGGGGGCFTFTVDD